MKGRKGQEGREGEGVKVRKEYRVGNRGSCIVRFASNTIARSIFMHIFCVLYATSALPNSQCIVMAT